MKTAGFGLPIALLALCAGYGFGCTVQNTAGAGGAGTGSTGGDTVLPSGGSMATSGATSSSGTAGMSDPGSVGKCTTMPSPPPAPPAEGMAKGPCDIYAADGGPCVAAHSTVRALYATYAGPLYQVKKTSDGSTKDIVPLAPGGLANSADQDTFCGADACTISIIYDQSGQGNHLTKAPAGGAKTTPDNEANAKAVSATVAGQKVYGVHIVPGVGYRNNNACGTAEGDNAETEYMVVAGDLFNGGCCFDYGNMERNSRDNGEGTMEAVYFGKCVIWGKGAGDGPWVMGDLENGLWAGDSSPYMMNTPLGFKYVTAMVKGDVAGSNHWTIKSGNAQMGTLVTPFDGHRPGSKYNPMRKEGGIGLGTGGDNSNGAQGNFFEGIMTAHYSTSAADDAVQASIVSVYGAP
ncbi:MAG TPA: arabinofuranosidase catalytic domain-containing protein [Polyangiaceae bacterium]|nr:arabinofuranosidase catalytic domain-containing protein [Polyangiaceae bacterium]